MIEFLDLLKSKCEHDGKVVIEVDRFFTSSKTYYSCLDHASFYHHVSSWSFPGRVIDHEQDTDIANNILGSYYS
ncbi:MAG: hypothetical protein KME40_01540 [Komarekiella atlantica HA4396-MV6]|nr:hypothetical protein [Komarekiella atlantica HA4396-MV6]